MIFFFYIYSCKKLHVLQRSTQTSLFFFETKTSFALVNILGWFCFVTCQSLAKLLVLVCCSLCFQKKVCLLHDSLLLFCLLQKKLFFGLYNGFFVFTEQQVTFVVEQHFIFVYCTEDCLLLLHNMLIFFIA
jgi:hypothetical protein